MNELGLNRILANIFGFAWSASLPLNQSWPDVENSSLCLDPSLTNPSHFVSNPDSPLRAHPLALTMIPVNWQTGHDWDGGGCAGYNKKGKGCDSCRRTFKLINVWFARIIRREGRATKTMASTTSEDEPWSRGWISGRSPETNNVCLFALILLFPHYKNVYYNRLVSCIRCLCSYTPPSPLRQDTESHHR